jgi:hypothetical protein
MRRRPHLASNIVEGVESFEKLQRKLSSGDEDASSRNHHVSLDDPSAASPSRHALIEPHDARFTAWLGFDSRCRIRGALTHGAVQVRVLLVLALAHGDWPPVHWLNWSPALGRSRRARRVRRRAAGHALVIRGAAACD